MKSRPPAGTSNDEIFVVDSSHGIDFARDGMPAVLSTPHLIRFLERAARFAIQPYLEAGESSVGIEIEIQHLAPTPLGSTVTCRARVVRAEGAEISFHVEAHDDHEIIAKGFHRRRVIRMDRFAARVAKKSGAAGRKT